MATLIGNCFFCGVLKTYDPIQDKAFCGSINCHSNQHGVLSNSRQIEKVSKHPTIEKIK